MIGACSSKSADFNAAELAKFIDAKYYEPTQTTKVNVELIRSEQSCRLDLRRWDAKFDMNNQRSYFKGHKRADVVAHGEQYFVFS